MTDRFILLTCVLSFFPKGLTEEGRETGAYYYICVLILLYEFATNLRDGHRYSSMRAHVCYPSVRTYVCITQVQHASRVKPHASRAKPHRLHADTYIAVEGAYMVA